ncbi:hypothetical protein JAAARDRAFT_130231 [Jaapia argillacea MUCL 33604]|uniref:HAD-like protein n=1 Tax=Jaapia argillacea MUCL 33604 TaxID=933084 RepID=A0A067Q1V8_9AGAM|nr:hypothetical protein JAAARDRAFT_130231 [Jaapia argillacea MUCL 33604]
MSPLHGFSTLICDIGDVLFTWSTKSTTSIPPRTLKAMMSSPTWYEYERARLTQDECYEILAKDFSYEVAEIACALDQARDSLTPNHEMVALLRELKTQSDGRLRIFAMSNISNYDYEVLRTKPTDWSVFDGVYTSAWAGQRKPNLKYYRQVVAATEIDPHSTIFIDDKAENVLSARSLGMHGIIFDSQAKVMRALRNLIGDPVERGRDFLRRNAGRLESITEGGLVVPEHFAQLLILEATQDRSLVTLPDEVPRSWNFFVGKPLLTTEEFPFDLDTTSLGSTVMKTDISVASSVMDEMLEYVNIDGVIQTYFDHTRPRFDPVVCANVLTLFYAHGRGSELSGTLEWVREVLYNRAYLDGTRYYTSPECFLFFLSRLLQSSDDSELHATLEPLLRERVQERIGTEGDALALAMRILTCASLGIRDEVDLRTLLPMQCEDGGWEIGWVYTYGSSGVKIGNRGFTTALAVKAVEAVEEASSTASSSPVSSPISSPGSETPPRIEDILQKNDVQATLPSRSPSRLSFIRRRLLSWFFHGGRVRSHALETTF